MNVCECLCMFVKNTRFLNKRNPTDRLSIRLILERRRMEGGREGGKNEG